MKETLPSEYLISNLETVLSAARMGPVLDLACGTGRNGLYLAGKGVEVHFWDKDKKNLEKIESIALENSIRAFFRQVDLETGQGGLLPAEYFSVVMVFRYLHRPLISEIKNSVLPGGIVVFRTYTTRQAELGKPSNPDFLLRDDELPGWFADWEIIDHCQGRLENPERYMAGIIAGKSIRLKV